MPLLLVLSPAGDLTSNTEVILAALPLRQRSYLAVKAEEITLLSVLGWRRSEEVRLEMTQEEKHPS